MKVYFSHPAASHSTERESRAFDVIRQDVMVQPKEIMDPKSLTVRKAPWWEYFVEIVKSDILVFMANEDKTLAEGVEAEVRFALAIGKPVYEVTEKGLVKIFELQETKK